MRTGRREELGSRPRTWPDVKGRNTGRFRVIHSPFGSYIRLLLCRLSRLRLSGDGMEMQFATNHIGHFYWTNLLLDKMNETAKATGTQGMIVNLSSLAHLFTYKEGIQFDKINDEQLSRQKSIWSIQISQHITCQRAFSPIAGKGSKYNCQLSASWFNNDKSHETFCPYDEYHKGFL
ncbi:hypothetical protein RND71_003093 [Anisodus tanguticus]|uniref:Uncharacterized protein n=1 Tax=Anisodus tanguticus TaxID=243964 RepID=A0AAE1SV99_9SOLA|nr:hypothetical protein RND71_003093 [Anisodus tanguticus]